ncbi:MAG TPA: alkaline phosphatase family protein [Candidatus Tumulicola sp.]|nr:alkaline phosphatase family protein [Candidatus Tumulicola sp.]
MHRRFLLLVALAALACAGCSGGGGGSQSGGSLPPSKPTPTPAPPASPIKHVVIMIQENRSFDDFFATYPGADGTTTGVTHDGKHVALTKTSLIDRIDIRHQWQTFVTEYDGGKMDGFDRIEFDDGQPAGLFPYQYVDPKQLQPYWTMARQYVLADHMFETQSSGSFVGHQELIAGSTAINSTQSLTNYPSNPPWGCDAPKSTVTSLITTHGFEGRMGPFPCLTYPTLRDSLDQAGVSWKYYAPTFNYQSGGYIWTAFDAIRAVRYSSEWKSNVITPQTRVFTDISKGTLPAVSWVIPDRTDSDHPQSHSSSGPAWVASVVDAIGQNPSLWKSTAIIIIWDDWGGFYDHMPPPQLDYQGLGFRVPMLVVSAYAKKDYVSHTQYEFGSILKFVEENFGLQPLGTTDVRATSIGNVFNLNAPPRPFHKIDAPLSKTYFERRPPSYEPVDTE